jgi:multiple sugar transport system permease protein
MDVTMQAILAKNRQKRVFNNFLTGMGFLAPNISGFLVFTLIPVFASFMLAFCQWDILNPAKFVGLGNFITLVTDKFFWRYFYNTLFFMLGIPLGMAASLGLALLISQSLKGVTFFRTIFFLPVVCSMVAVALLWRWIYNPDFGLLNSFLRFLGFTDLPQWLSSTFWAKPAIMIMGVWQGAGYNMLLYLAAIQGIPRTYYEAAEIDGATKGQQFLNITWPLLGPTNFFMIIMGVIGGFQTFGSIFVMTAGGPAGSTTTIVYYIYNNAFQWFKMGYASSIAWFLFLIMFVVTLLQWRYAGEKVSYSF